jgi:hypothetical protein
MSFINLPAMQIPLPGFVVYFLDKGYDMLSTAYTHLQTASEWMYISPEMYAHLKANAFLLFGISIIFWPLLLSLITTFTVMGTWTFWLFTTSIFGILQVGPRTACIQAIEGGGSLLLTLPAFILFVLVGLCGLSICHDCRGYSGPVPAENLHNATK